MAKLLDAVTSNTVGSSVDFNGDFSVHAWGVFDGAIITVEASDDTDLTEFDAISPLANFTSGGWFTACIRGAGKLRATLINAGGNTNVTVTMQQ